ncbi:MAG: class I SAM-dependent methyltransferase [Candidatus Omnitrophica bacterium]|nr:class I SAM-dependent methyltransferase [Candidatus Omnitrophota bacterium]
MIRKLICALKIVREISKLDRDCELDKLVDFAFTRCLGLIKPSQVKKEILKLLIILNRIKPNSVLEIGTESGGTLFLFTRVASEDATIISIDLPGGPFGGGYPKWRVPFYKSFALPNQKIHLLRADSHDETTLEKVKTILTGREIDFLFIDGDHTYEGVKKDFEMYSPLVKKNGIIALHDIVPHLRRPNCKVSRFWNEIKFKYDHVEIVNDWNQNWAGIGVIKNSRSRDT